ncbi:MAG: 2-oxoacid:acceptor oxidoreductase subunit alpha [bacterium]
MRAVFNNEVSIVLAGEAGQGIQSIESMLAALIKRDGYHLLATKEYMSRVRGGINSTELRVASKRVQAYVSRIDILIPLDKAALPHLKNRITSKTVILGEKDKLENASVIDIPFSKLGAELGNVIYSSTIAVGLIGGLLKIDEQKMYEYISAYFSKKSEEIKKKNIEAAKIGYELAGKLAQSIDINIARACCTEEEVMFNGSDAVALGALAGGCNFVCAYPMTPGTGVFTALAGYSKTMGIVVEQVEDEIGVMNMALGAWYAGARALVSTSGGGFALMTEAISLAGMIESPAVIHLAQRPGPATGLPTRTEQGDLNLVLYAGHGEFPRIILAPGNTAQAFFLSQKAFNLADKYQLPVFILTDQYFVDTYYNIPEPKLDGLKVIKNIIETKKGYKRYEYSDCGISPRGIPGFGEGLVCADSDEHDEEGRITEDLDGVRVPMTKKRMLRAEQVEKNVIAPDLLGAKAYSTLIVCWGSTLNTIVEALELSGKKDIGVLHYTQVYPLHASTEQYLKKAKKVVLIENNAGANFGRLIKSEIGIDIPNKILKYNGMPFSVEEVLAEIEKL